MIFKPIGYYFDIYCFGNMNFVRIQCLSVGYYFYSHNLAAIKMVTQSYKAEAIRFYDYCLTNAKVIILFSTKRYGLG